MMRTLKRVAIAMLSVVLAAAGLAYLFAPHPPAVPQRLATVSELNAYFEALAQSGNPPAVSATVVKDGVTVYSGGFGLANPETGAGATPQTVYHWWSMTKVVTAVAILQLAESGALDLDDPVIHHLPFFDVAYDGQPRTDISVRQLLSHTSGLPDCVPAIIGWVHYDDIRIDQTALLKAKLPDYRELVFAPGTGAGYTNLGYLVLGAVIEAVTEMPYEDYIEKAVLAPLGMTSTGFVYRPDLAEDEARGSHPIVNLYTLFLPFLLDLQDLVASQDGSKWWLNRVYIDATPPTGLIGPATDVAVFMKAYLAAGQGAEVALLSPASIAAMMPRSDALDGRALGWAEFATTGRVFVQHRGGGPGFAAMMRLYPEEGLGIALFANGTALDDTQLVEAIAGMNW